MASTNKLPPKLPKALPITHPALGNKFTAKIANGAAPVVPKAIKIAKFKPFPSSKTAAPTPKVKAYKK